MRRGAVVVALLLLECIQVRCSVMAFLFFLSGEV
jgi:hypothetical protein